MAEEIIVMQLKAGDVEIRLFPEVAPNHVARIKTLVKEKFYDGIVFHRVIDGFMVQVGDPTGTGSGGSTYPDLKAEFNTKNHERGTLSMARATSPDSANSQFFIMLAASSHLDNQYTVWGEVIKGMDVVDKIKKGDQSNNGMVKNPDKIISMILVDRK